MNRVVLVAWRALVAAAGAAAPSPPNVPDRIVLLNGRVWTGDQARPRATAPEVTPAGGWQPHQTASVEVAGF